jgi:hypothetical protein
MHRMCMFGFIAGITWLISVTQVLGQQVCKPSLAFKKVQFSDMQPPSLKRTWTAVISVDATGCVPNATGYFQIIFSRIKEMAPDMQFAEQFKWLSPSVRVTVDFSPDEAVHYYLIDNVTSCPCAH